jgi:uroporphyrinogen decarboxylase
MASALDPRIDNDFARIRACLLGEGQPDRLPLWELHADRPVKEAFLGRPIASMADEVDFWRLAGYDYVPLSAGLVRVAGVLGGTTATSDYSLYEETSEISWAPEHEGPITSFAALRDFPWPDPDEIDLSFVEEAAALLPPRMGIIAIIGKIFTSVWMLMGLERFAIATVEEPDLVAAVFERVAKIQVRVCERCAAIPRVGGLWMSDDVAYTEGLLVSPTVLREHLFPPYRHVGDICREEGIAYIYHSDGDLTAVMDDILACGFHGLHPIEPKAMDARALKRRWGDRLALLGNVEMDLLARGTPEQVRARTEANIRDLGYDGRYGVGSSNSVSYYVPLENYLAMRDAGLSARV